MNTGCGCEDCQNYKPRAGRVKDLIEFLTNIKVPDNSTVSIDYDMGSPTHPGEGILVIQYGSGTILQYRLPIWQGLPK